MGHVIDSGAAHLHVVVSGVSGTGKSSVATALAAELGLQLGEGDDYHSAANIDKMASGQPLTDADRAPWLDELAQWTRQCHDANIGTVLTCSALRRSYRDVLAQAVPEPTWMIQLVADPDVLNARMLGREHFMPVSLLESQLATLEPLQSDEDGVVVDAAAPLIDVVQTVKSLILGPDEGRSN